MAHQDDPVTAITNSCTSIAALDFSPPGIFTNAIITKPEVTSLIRDALEPELSLYRVTRNPGLASLALRYGSSHAAAQEADPFAELRTERVDGKSIYIGHGFSADRTPAIRVPELVREEALPQIGDQLSSPTKKRIASQYNLIPASVIESDNINEICKAVASVVEQYPNINNGTSVRASLASLQKEYAELVDETNRLEETVAHQRAQLDAYSEAMLLPRRATQEQQTQDIDDLIAREEREIAGLEAELDSSQRE